MMDAKIKQMWLEALRSGAYKQARGVLRTSSTLIAPSYCCLGVLCKVQGADLNKEFDDFETADLKRNEDCRNWSAGLTQHECDWLANMNDNGKSFVEIADYIDATF